jgi:hypothetical protein
MNILISIIFADAVLKQRLLERLKDLERRFISGERASPSFCSRQVTGVEITTRQL